ncbi:hypothetical protein EXU48_07985 [Occultella glacieicola]|uniref:Uncharacterized protein n=1 Tax=Occultella glacieicola TaxID=2518684 RepID=A0ABY2E733_9MICO|nr:DUF6541 family protein [Occultella glacieicola]TDE96161.1 hypothetical protein EXU48_07985 [Occultella glacieicola]
MPTTNAFLALAVFGFGLLLLYAPGVLTLRLVGLRGLTLAALAPPVTVAALSLTAILTRFAGKDWGLVPATIGLAATFGAALVLRALGIVLTPEEVPGSRRLRTVLMAGLAAGLILAVVPVAVGAGGVDSLLQRWDAVYHLSALRLIDETRSASSLTVGALSYGTGQAHLYPAGWHAFASLLPLSSPTAVLNLAGTLTSGPAWVLGCAALARRVWPHLPPAPALVGFAAGLITATPMSLWIGWGHLPNAAALAMTPGVLAFGIGALDRAGVSATARLSGRAGPSGRVGPSGGVGSSGRVGSFGGIESSGGVEPSRRTGPSGPLGLPTGWHQHAAGVVVLGAGAVGLGLTHPNAFLALAVVALPVAVAAVVRIARAASAAGHRAIAVGLPAALTVVTVGGALAFAVSPLAASVTGYVGDEPDGAGAAVGSVLVGWYELWPHVVTAAVVVAAPYGAVLAWRRGAPWAAGMLAVVWVLYIDAAMGGPTGISALWYTSPARLSVVTAMVTVVLAVGALVQLGVAAARRWSGARARAVAAASLAVLLAAAVVASSLYKAERTAKLYDPDATGVPRFVTAAELEMLAEVDLEPGAAVLGSPFSGAALLYGLHGVPVVFPIAGQVWSPAQQTIMGGLDDLSDPEVCAALDELGVRYLYQDSRPYQASGDYRALDDLEVPGAEVVAEADTARILRLPDCHAG